MGGAILAPAAVRTVDLDAPAADLVLGPSRSGEPYRSLIAIACSRGRPVASVLLDAPDGRVTEERLTAALREQAVRGPARDAQRSGRAHVGLVSVAIATCGALDALQRCLRSVLASDWRALDVIVIDNRPATSSVRAMLTERFSGERRLRYVAEPRRGLSWSRNAGLEHARGEIVAFTDDDVIVEASWVRALVEAFGAAPDVACVTGLLLPPSLESRTQVLLHEFAGFAKGFEPRTFRLSECRRDDPLMPYSAGRIGTGANGALRRQAALGLGGFDVRLGTGTAARGGEDLDLFIRLLLAGHAIAYEPAALVWHELPDGPRALRAKVLQYGVGLGATMAKQLVTGPDRLGLVRRVPAALRHVTDPSSRKNEGKTAGYPRRLDALERAGMLAGPLAYAASAVIARPRRAAA